MAGSAAARWRSNSRLPLSAHWRSSRTRTTGWSCDDRGQETDHRGEEQVTLGVGVGGLGRRQVRDAAGQGRAPVGTVRTRGPPRGPGALFGGVGDVVPEGLGEQPVGGGQVLVAVTEQHAGPVVEGRPGRLGHQGRLTLAGLAGDEEDLAAQPLATRLAARSSTPVSVCTADHSDRRAEARRAGSGIDARVLGASERLPEHLDGLHRVGQALQLELAERPTLVPAAPTGHGPHDIGRQDLPALAPGTQPGRLDDRVPEVVVVLLARPRPR